MARVPSRPTHTGTARVEARKAAAHALRVPAAPTHLRLKQAAVALEAPTGPTPTQRLVRHATRPLPLAHGRVALALRQIETHPIEVLVRTPAGQQGWRPLSQVMTPDLLRAWVREGFAIPGLRSRGVPGDMSAAPSKRLKRKPGGP